MATRSGSPFSTSADRPYRHLKIDSLRDFGSRRDVDLRGSPRRLPCAGRYARPGSRILLRRYTSTPARNGGPYRCPTATSHGSPPRKQAQRGSPSNAASSASSRVACSFRVPEIVFVSNTGFDVRRMVPGRCDPGVSTAAARLISGWRRKSDARLGKSSRNSTPGSSRRTRPAGCGSRCRGRRPAPGLANACRASSTTAV